MLKLTDEVKLLRTEMSFLRDAIKLNALMLKQLTDKIEKVN